jgi:hypothetical protein
VDHPHRCVCGGELRSGGRGDHDQTKEKLSHDVPPVAVPVRAVFHTPVERQGFILYFKNLKEH